MKDDLFESPIDGSTGKHPTCIEVAFNPAEGKWDLALLVGNFASEQAATEYAEIVAEFLRDNASAVMLRRQ